MGGAICLLVIGQTLCGFDYTSQLWWKFLCFLFMREIRHTGEGGSFFLRHCFPPPDNLYFLNGKSPPPPPPPPPPRTASAHYASLFLRTLIVATCITLVLPPRRDRDREREREREGGKEGEREREREWKDNDYLTEFSQLKSYCLRQSLGAKAGAAGTFTLAAIWPVYALTLVARAAVLTNYMDAVRLTGQTTVNRSKVSF